MLKKITSLISAFIGIVVVILGIILASTNVSSQYFSAKNEGYDVPGASFGADFYTYMYDASDEIVSALDNISDNTAKIVSVENYLVEKSVENTSAIYKAGGIVVVAIGLAIIVYSLSMISSAFSSQKKEHEIRPVETYIHNI